LARGKTITLKGAAARAFVETLKGVEPENEIVALERIATRIHMEMSSGNMKGAVAVLQLLLRTDACETSKALS
jgi:hypothetical protein